MLALPPFFWWLHAMFRKWRPSQLETLKRFQAEVVHAENLQREFRERAPWDDKHDYHGEFLVRDAERKLPHTIERHNSQEGRHSILVLTAIHREYLEFTSGSFGITHIKQIADSWYTSDASEEGAVKVWAVYRLSYRDIVAVSWETDEYWEWPQVSCRFPRKNKFPFSEVFYAEQRTGLPRPFFHKVCDMREVRSERPPHA